MVVIISVDDLTKTFIVLNPLLLPSGRVISVKEAGNVSVSNCLFKLHRECARVFQGKTLSIKSSQNINFVDVLLCRLDIFCRETVRSVDHFSTGLILDKSIKCLREIFRGREIVRLSLYQNDQACNYVFNLKMYFCVEYNFTNLSRHTVLWIRSIHGPPRSPRKVHVSDTDI